jgi:CarD family transcriptional regulator
MSFEIGDKVVYPNQGVCKIEGISERSIAGRQEQFFMLRILSNESTVMIPLANVENVGLRRLSDQSDLESLFDILQNSVNEPDPDWKNRYKDNLERMKTGCIFEVGRVLQDLYFLSFQKPLSFREKKMYDRARQLVVSEIATVREEELPEAEGCVDQMLDLAYKQFTPETPVG